MQWRPLIWQFPSHFLDRAIRGTLSLLVIIPAFGAPGASLAAGAEETGTTAEQAAGTAWYAYSSGNMLAEKSTEKVPGVQADVEHLTFHATEKLPGDYWVGAGVAMAHPRGDNLVEFYIRKTSPQQRTVIVKLLDSAGRQGYYELSVPSDWIKVQLWREQPVHTGGGETPQDIAKIEFILLNTWFKPGETWTVDVAGVKTRPGRTLITHSFIPTRFSAPVTELRSDAMAFLQPGGQEKLLGFGGIRERTDLITGEKQAVTSDNDGYVRVSNDGWNLRGVSVEER